MVLDFHLPIPTFRGRRADRVLDAAFLQRFLDLRLGEGRVGAERQARALGPKPELRPAMQQQEWLPSSDPSDVEGGAVRLNCEMVHCRMLRFALVTARLSLPMGNLASHNAR